MRRHEYLPAFEEKFLQILDSSNSIEPMFKKLRAAFNEIHKVIPLAKDVTMELVETESLRGSVFYQSGRLLSKYAILIYQKNNNNYLYYENYIWFDNGELVFNDDTFYNDDIVMHLAMVPTLNHYPESVRDLMWLLKNDLWKISLNRLPRFSENPPKDIHEVLSWDNSHLLIGTTSENYEMITREYWDDLCQREKNWFEEN